MSNPTGWRVAIDYDGPDKSKCEEIYSLYLPKSEYIEYYDFKRFDDEFSNVEKRIHQLVEKYNIVKVNIIAKGDGEAIFTGWFKYGKVNIFCERMESIEIENCPREEFYKAIFECLEKIKEWAKEYSRYEAERIRSIKSRKMTKS